MAEALYLHIGVPKTGTTYVQGILRSNLVRLRRQGYGLASSGQPDLVRAMFDLSGRRSGPQIAGAWDRQAKRIVAESGTVLLSQEELCITTTERIGRLLASVGTDDVTVVVTARDLARQVASYWQQMLKARFPGSLGEMVDLIVSRAPTEDDFWGHQDLVAIADRWLAHLPPERIIVVTVPPAGQPPELLWERFASACGLDPGGFDLDVDRTNEALGAAQAELLRRINVELGDRLMIGAGYYAVVRTHLANDLLARQPHHQPYGLDLEAHGWATTTATGWVEGLRSRGLPVVGDLADLVPPPWQPTASQDVLDDASVGRTAVTALADLLAEASQRTRKQLAAPPPGGAKRRNLPSGKP